MPRPRHSSSNPHLSLLPISLLALALTSPASAQQQNDTSSSGPGTKRGLSWIGTSHSDDDNLLFTSSASALTWYKTWSSWPIRSARRLEFVPMIHSLENIEQDLSNIRGGNAKYVLTFNEPDGNTDSGGTSIDAEGAAEAWAEIAKLREDGHMISLPATTGSGPGFEWLEEFNESCWQRYEETGCEFDFVAAHWYGAFEGLAAWLGRLHEAWPDQKIWVTEMALPQPADEEEVLGMMNQSLRWMDETGWVERYAWFGAFRDDEANSWTGDVVSLLDDDGGLTELGSVYMGGEAEGFPVGKSEQGVAAGLKVQWSLVAASLSVAMAGWFWR